MLKLFKNLIVKVVSLKKKYIKHSLLPHFLSKRIDGFLNESFLKRKKFNFLFWKKDSFLSLQSSFKKNKPNFILICLHSLDMRDFHSYLRKTPFLDELRKKSIFIPMGRSQGHHCKDSLNAELTGMWTARYGNSILTEKGSLSYGEYKPFPKTVIEYLKEDGYDIFTCMKPNFKKGLGTFAAQDAETCWFASEKDRLKQFACPKEMDLDEWLANIKNSKKFYAHIFLRGTHRPWAQPEELLKLAGISKENYIEGDLISAARKLALEKPDEFALLRRKGLEMMDKEVKKIFEATKDIKDTVYLIYSNHGEVYDHFRYNLSHPTRNSGYNGVEDFVEGTSHANFPYEVLYANMQMWLTPYVKPKFMKGLGRSIDITPTILELAGVKHEVMDGESMLSNFVEGFFPERDRYAETPEGFAISMARKDGYKLISMRSNQWRPEHRLAVFDLKTDPYEYVNIVGTTQGQEVLEWAIKKHKELKK